MDQVLEAFADNVSSLVILINQNDPSLISKRDQAVVTQIEKLIILVSRFSKDVISSYQPVLSSKLPIISTEHIQNACKELNETLKTLANLRTLVKPSEARNALSVINSILIKVVELIILKDQMNIEIFAYLARRLYLDVKNSSSITDSNSFMRYAQPMFDVHNVICTTIDQWIPNLSNKDWREMLTLLKIQFVSDYQIHVEECEKIARNQDRSSFNLSAELYSSHIDESIILVRRISDNIFSIFGNIRCMQTFFPTIAEDKVLQDATAFLGTLLSWKDIPHSNTIAINITQKTQELLSSLSILEGKCGETTDEELLRRAFSRTNANLKTVIQSALLTNREYNADPNDPLKKEMFNRALEEFDNAQRACVSMAYTHSGLSSVATIATTYVESLALLKDALLGSDHARAIAILSNINNVEKLFFDSLGDYVSSIKATADQERMKSDFQKLRTMSTDVVHSGKRAADSIKDIKLRETYCMKYYRFLTELGRTISTDELMGSYHNETTLTAQKCADEFKNARSHTRKHLNRVAKQAYFGKELANNISDPTLKGELLKAIEDEQKSAAKFVRIVEMNPNDTNIPQIRKKMECVVDSSLKVKKCCEKSAAHKLLSQKDDSSVSGHTELSAAANRIEQSINQVVIGSVPNARKMNEAVETGNSIAKLMKILSSAYDTGNMSEMITKSKEIMNFIRELTTLSHKFQERCEDSLLSEELRVHSEAAQNFGIQLKLICAMKATSGNKNDVVSEEQLVYAGNEIAKAVSNLVNAVCAAGLHKSVRSTLIE